MLRNALFHSVLVAPALDGADELCVISGYASPAISERHAHTLAGLGISIKRRLVVGMAGESGVEIADHERWCTLVDAGGLDVAYTRRGSSDHSKTYVWMKRGTPVVAWSGSANYSLEGFGLGGRNRRETVARVDERTAFAHFVELRDKSATARDARNHDLVDFVRTVSPPSTERVPPISTVPEHAEAPSIVERVVLPLIQKRNGEVHNAGAGLNWGQRGNRRRDEAYIPVPRDVQRSGFFPEVGRPFTVQTDDGQEIVMVRAQQSGKALHSHSDNAIIGRYMRERLGITPGAPVTTAALHAYGRTTVDFYRLEDGGYRLSFDSDGEGHEGDPAEVESPEVV